MDEAGAVLWICGASSVAVPAGVSTVRELAKQAAESTTLGPALDAAAAKWGGGAFWDAVHKWCEARLPVFVYFDEYGQLPSTTNMPALQQRIATKTTSDSDRTVLALLTEARIPPAEFQEDHHFEKQQTQLESAGTRITKTLYSYWNQNAGNKIVFHKSQPDRDAEPDVAQGLNLHIGLVDRRDTRVPVGQGSHGFRWFFSFIAYFSQFAEREADDRDVVLLLDEPGTALHALAQADFLRVIEDHLKPQAQVLYTTHSPFLVNPSRYDRVRIVQDTDSDGTLLDERALHINDPDTVFPLQAALGYSIGQTLWVAPHAVLVEGPSDYLYLQVFKRAIARRRPDSILDERAVLVPVDGIDKMPTFVRLFGANQLTLAALIDAGKRADKVRVEMLKTEYLSEDTIVTMADVISQEEADIEDLFPDDFYAELVSKAKPGTPLAMVTAEALAQRDEVRVVKRVEGALETLMAGVSQSFSHHHPAVYLHRMQDDYLDLIPDETLDKVAQIFVKVNKALGLGKTANSASAASGKKRRDPK